jgi:putative cardiolipin synthase
VEKPKRDLEAIKQTRGKLAKHWEEVRATEKGRKLLESRLYERLKDADIALTWAHAELVSDKPHKVDQEPEDTESKPLLRLDTMLDRAHTEFIAVSPYFVPREEGVELLSALVARGVKVSVVTNSLASTDVVAVHTGYRRYREAVVRSGVDIYEMKATGGERPEQRLIGKSAPAQASLHAKVYVIDGKDTMISSFNLDPRSIELNTEIALIIHSKEISDQVRKLFDEVILPENSYKLAINDQDKLVWRSEEEGKAVELTGEPKPGFWRSIQMNLMSVLPIENSL